MKPSNARRRGSLPSECLQADEDQIAVERKCSEDLAKLRSTLAALAQAWRCKQYRYRNEFLVALDLAGELTRVLDGEIYTAGGNNRREVIQSVTADDCSCI